jgi:hypothetical protein
MEGSCGGIPWKRAGLALWADLQENSEDVGISEGARPLLSVWDNHGFQPRAGGGETFIPIYQGFPCGCSLVRRRGPGADVTFLCAISGSLMFASRVLSMVCLRTLATLLGMGACGTEERPRIEQRYPVGAVVGRNTVISFCSAMACNGLVAGLDHRETCKGEIHQILPDRIPQNSGARLCVACNVFVF